MLALGPGDAASQGWILIHGSMDYDQAMHDQPIMHGLVMQASQEGIRRM